MQDTNSTLKVGVVGYGYWGPNIVRNFNAVDSSHVVAICDANGDRLGRALRQYTDVRGHRDYTEVTRATDIDIVAVVTPTFSHYEIAKDALLHDKHIFVEKPFSSTVAQAEELIELAERKQRLIMVDHTFLFTGAVMKIKEVVGQGELGQLCYFESTRVNLGLLQQDVNVVWDLAPHDFSIIDHVVENRPLAVAATGMAHFGRTLEDVAYVTLYFGGDMIAHFTFNWLSPVKIRRTIVGGRDKILVWDDLNSDEKVRIYDRGVDITSADKNELLINYRVGDMYSPYISNVEALKAECSYFVDCIAKQQRPFNDGEAGLRVLRMLAAADKSLSLRGEAVEL